MGDFLTDVQTLRARAREQIEAGPITGSYGADRDRVVAVLNEALATELVCVLRYKRHYFMAQGINASNAATEFLQHATDEQGHADRIAGRIVQLLGEPNGSRSPPTTRSFAWLGDKDVTTRRLIEDILAVEEEHADDLLTLLQSQ